MRGHTVVQALALLTWQTALTEALGLVAINRSYRREHFF